MTTATRVDGEISVLESRKGVASWRWPLVVLFVGFVGFVVAVAHHFLSDLPKTTFSFDSRHYLLTCANVTGLLLGLVRGQSPGEGVSDGTFHEFLLLDGPVLPSLYAALFAFAGHVPTPADWRTVVTLQAVMHGLCASLVAILAHQVGARRIWSAVAGLLWALYPPAIVAAGRMLTEPLAGLMLLALAYFLLGAAEKMALRPLAGVLAGLTILLKPAVIPAVCLSALAVCLAARRRFVFLATLFAAVAFAIAPWALYTHVVTGHMAMTVQRGPTYNVAKGWDIEADAWGAVPDPPLTALFKQPDEPLTTAWAMWIAHPAECASLVARKVTSMLTFPWNDFRHPCLGLAIAAQRGWHVALLYLGILGIIAWMLAGCGASNHQKRLGGLVCFIFALGQLTYLMFEPVPRYGFTIMPFLAIFAAQGLTIVPVWALARRWLAVACLAGAFLLTGALVSARAFSTPPDGQEIAHALRPGAVVRKVVDLSGCVVPVKPLTALVMVDGDGAMDRLRLAVNGHRVDGRLMSLNHLDAGKYKFFTLMRDFAQAMGVEVEDFRQWRAVVVPEESLNLRGRNVIELTQEFGESIIYGDAERNCRTLPSPAYFSHGKLGAETDSLEPRIKDPVLTGRVKEASFIGGCRTDSPGAVADVLRVKIVFASGVSPPGNVQTLPAQPFRRALVPEDFPLLLRDRQEGVIRINKPILKATTSTGCLIAVPPLGAASHVRLSIAGQARAAGKAGRFGLVPVLLDKKGTALVCQAPRCIATGSDWRSFEIKDTIPIATLGGGISNLLVTLYPGPWQEVAEYGCIRAGDTQLRGLTVELVPEELPDLEGKRLFIY